MGCAIGGGPAGAALLAPLLLLLLLKFISSMMYRQSSRATAVGASPDIVGACTGFAIVQFPLSGDALPVVESHSGKHA